MHATEFIELVNWVAHMWLSCVLVNMKHVQIAFLYWVIIWIRFFFSSYFEFVKCIRYFRCTCSWWHRNVTYCFSQTPGSVDSIMACGCKFGEEKNTSTFRKRESQHTISASYRLLRWSLRHKLQLKQLDFMRFSMWSVVCCHHLNEICNKIIVRYNLPLDPVANALWLFNNIISFNAITFRCVVCFSFSIFF